MSACDKDKPTGGIHHGYNTRWRYHVYPDVVSRYDKSGQYSYALAAEKDETEPGREPTYYPISTQAAMQLDYRYLWIGVRAAYRLADEFDRAGFRHVGRGIALSLGTLERNDTTMHEFIRYAPCVVSSTGGRWYRRAIRSVTLRILFRPPVGSILTAEQFLKLARMTASRHQTIAESIKEYLQKPEDIDTLKDALILDELGKDR